MSIQCITHRIGYKSAEPRVQLQMHCGISGRAIFSAVPVRYLPACLQVGWCCAITMLSQKHVVCCDLVIFGHELIHCHSWMKKKKNTRSVYEVCVQTWVLLPWQGICHEILFLTWQRKVKGKDKKKGQEAKQREMNFTPKYLPGWGADHHHFQSFCSLTAVLSILRFRFH